MAGKHFNTTQSAADLSLALPILGIRQPNFPGTPADRAYAEGRQAGIDGVSAGANPHAAEGFNADSFQAWSLGRTAAINGNGSWEGSQWQTAIEGVPNP